MTHDHYNDYHYCYYYLDSCAFCGCNALTCIIWDNSVGRLISSGALPTTTVCPTAAPTSTPIGATATPAPTATVNAPTVTPAPATATPAPTAAPTATPAAPTATPTPTPSSFAYFISDFGDASAVNACSSGIGSTIVYGANANPSSVTKFFTDSGLTTDFDGGNEYWAYARTDNTGIVRRAIISNTGNLSSGGSC